MTMFRTPMLHIVLLLATVLAIAMGAPVASAAEPVRWIAQSDGFWDVAANWNSGVVPGVSPTRSRSPVAISTDLEI
jgi:hypothetical protein